MPFRRLIPALAAAAALALLPALPAQAAADTGWVRLAHLSPDTRAVDVRLAPLDGGGSVTRLSNVAYGAVSDYLSLPVGTYALAMRPAGASDSASPVVQGSVQVEAGKAKTVAVFGRNADLKVKVIDDALTAPAAGDARVRAIQAVTGDPVTVRASRSGDDETLLSDAGVGEVTNYSVVPSGTWKVTADRGSTSTTSSVAAKAGQVLSVFILEDADGGLTIKRVLDSSSAGTLPKGYLATGGGFLAHQEEARDGALAVTAGGALALAAAATASLLALRRRRLHA